MRVLSAEVMGEVCVLTVERRRWLIWRAKETWISDKKMPHCPVWLNFFHPAVSEHSHWFHQETEREAACWLACALDDAWNRAIRRKRLLNQMSAELDKRIGLDVN